MASLSSSDLTEVASDPGATLDELVEQLARAPSLVPRGQLPPGTRAGDYELEEVIGRGAFGTVYRAVHPVIGKEVAVKVLDRADHTDPRLEQRFVTEARAVNRVNHSNIVDIFGFGELDNGQMFYVMELLLGENLSTLLKRFRPLPPAVVLQILDELADALDAAHAAGILHRDLKPANVFLHRAATSPVKVKLLDFGVAKVLELNEVAATTTSAAIGTPAYMSPEQWAGDPLRAATDIYALGVIGFEMLTGERPFRAAGTRELVKGHLFSDVPDASSINQRLPRAVDAPLRAMLAKAPEARPRSARAAVQALRQALDAEGGARAALTLPSALPTVSATGSSQGEFSAAQGVASPSSLAAPRAGRGSWPWLLAVGLGAGALALVLLAPKHDPGEVSGANPSLTASALPGPADVVSTPVSAPPEREPAPVVSASPPPPSATPSPVAKSPAPAKWSAPRTKVVKPARPSEPAPAAADGKARASDLQF